MNIDFEKIKRSVSTTAKKAKRFSENTFETAKLKLKLSDIKSDINERYTKIGKLVYESNEDSDYTGEIEKLCAEISELKASMAEINDVLDELSNSKMCPGCDSNVKKEFEFCPKCGYDFTNK